MASREREDFYQRQRNRSGKQQQFFQFHESSSAMDPTNTTTIVDLPNEKPRHHSQKEATETRKNYTLYQQDCIYYYRWGYWFLIVVLVLQLIQTACVIAEDYYIQQRSEELSVTISTGHKILLDFQGTQLIETIGTVVSDFQQKNYALLQSTLQTTADAVSAISTILNSVQANNATDTVQEVLLDSKQIVSFISSVLAKSAEEVALRNAALSAASSSSS